VGVSKQEVGGEGVSATCNVETSLICQLLENKCAVAVY
jgi:hypothetical protein